MKKSIHYLVFVFFILPIVYLWIIWNRIPQVVPLHWDMKGNIDKYGDKNQLSNDADS